MIQQLLLDSIEGGNIIGGVETLFDLHEYSRKKICATCSKEFLPSQNAQRFCCPKCKRSFFHQKESAKLKAQFEFIQHNDIPLPENLSEKDKEAVELYTKRKFGVNFIARWQERNSFSVKRGLIQAGVYRPRPEQNTTARAGTGPHSNVLKREMSEERKKEWENKVQICLQNLKQGVGIETTCHANGWTPAGVWFHLYRNNEYKEWKAAHPAKPANVKQYERGRQFEWRSKKYAVEDEFQDAIAQLLNGFNVPFVREKKLARSRSRMDFELNASTFLECKICTKSNIFMRAIGQALIARTEKKDVWLVIPDDVSLREDQRDLLQQEQIPLFSETGLRQRLAGQESVRVQTKTTGVVSFCKCCTKENVVMSRSPGGDARSYCIDCETKVKQRVFDQRLNRWVKPA